MFIPGAAADVRRIGERKVSELSHDLKGVLKTNKSDKTSTVQLTKELSKTLNGVEKNTKLNKPRAKSTNRKIVKRKSTSIGGSKLKRAKRRKINWGDQTLNSLIARQ